MTENDARRRIKPKNRGGHENLDPSEKEKTRGSLVYLSRAANGAQLHHFTKVLPITERYE
jgi:hypothetical protein